MFKVAAPKKSSAPANRMAVLNISNLNAQGEVVLNDERLLQLVHLYPFLYNQHLGPNQDQDYEEWAWERITVTFNRAYEGTSMQFTSSELQMRWETLRPIIKSLSRATNTAAIPESLRQIVLSITRETESDNDKNEPPQPKVYSKAHALMLDNMEMVEELPLEERKRLEAQVMEELLNAELKGLGTIKMSSTARQQVEKEADDFLKAIGMDEFFVSEINGNDADDSNGLGGTASYSCTTPDFVFGDVDEGEMILPDEPHVPDLPAFSCSASNDSSTMDAVLQQQPAPVASASSNANETVVLEVKVEPIDMDLAGIATIVHTPTITTTPTTTNVQATPAPRTASSGKATTTTTLLSSKAAAKESAATTTTTESATKSPSPSSPQPSPPATTEPLLEPLPVKRWVPLAQAIFFVRNCRVRIKRIDLDEHLPLAKVKRERLW